jgi:type IV secretion system protein VirB5
MTSVEANQVLPQPAQMATGSRKYLEQYAALLVSNRHLRVAILCVTVLSLGLLVLNLKTVQTLRNFKPLVIRINEIGRAEAVSYDSLAYQPRDAEMKYFLIQFVTKHYGRMRATVRESYARSLYFLDGRLADSIIETNKKNRTIETLLAGQGDEVDIEVKNVTVEDLRQPPYKATVDFDKIYYSGTDRAESRREKYVASFVFVVRDRVPNAWIPVNPLGLVITYFREDQAFR